MQETPRKGADTRERILDVAEASVLEGLRRHLDAETLPELDPPLRLVETP